MKINASKGIIALGLVVSTMACGPKMQTVTDEQNESSNDPDSSSTKTRETVVAGVSLSQKGAGFALAGSTDFTMRLEGCASGLTFDISQSNPNVSLYKYDTGCLIKLSQFDFNGKTYDIDVAFDTYNSNGFATFKNTADATDKLKVVVTHQLNSPVASTGGAETVSYTFSQISTGTPETIASEVVSPTSHTLSVSGDDAVDMDIVAVAMTGMTGAGAGQFDFTIDCSANITGTSPNTICGAHTITSLKYRLVQDTYSGTLTAVQAAALFNGSESSVAGGDLLAIGSGASHGGYTAHVQGPDQMHLNPGMLFVIQSGSSYRYFNVDVTTLTYTP